MSSVDNTIESYIYKRIVMSISFDIINISFFIQLKLNNMFS